LLEFNDLSISDQRKSCYFSKDFLIIPVISPELSDNNFPHSSCISAAAGRKVSKIRSLIRYDIIARLHAGIIDCIDTGDTLRACINRNIEYSHRICAKCAFYVPVQPYFQHK